MNAPIWIIIEEYEPNDHDDTLTNILPEYYETEVEAFDALYDLAVKMNVDMEYGYHKFLAPPAEGIFRDTYYITELNRG